MLAAYLRRLPQAALASALILIIAIIDWRVQANIYPADVAGGDRLATPGECC